LSEAAIWARINRGELPAIRIAGRVFLHEEELRSKLGELYQPIAG